MTSDPSSHLRVETSGSTTVLTFDRPEALNALNQATQHALLSEIGASAEREDRTLIVTGAGRAFCTGQDLKEMAGFSGGVTDEAIEAARVELSKMQSMTRALQDHPGATLAAINGVAVGLGAELALACDLRLIGKEGSIAFPEARRGLFQTNGVMFLLPRLIGHGRALELMLTGRTVRAEEAERIGLAERVPATALDAAKEKAEIIARNAPTATRAIKRGALRALDLPFNEVLDLEVEGMVAALRTEDLWEGLAAFVEGREPDWPGR